MRARPGLRYGTLWRALVVSATAGYGIVAFVPWFLGTSETRVATVPYHAAVLLLAAVLLVWTWKAGRTLRLDLPLTLLALFAVLYTCRLAAATLGGSVETRLPPEEYWLDWLGTCVIPAVAVLALVSRETLEETGRTMSRIFLAVVVLAFLYRAAEGPALAAEGSVRSGAPALSGIWFGHFGASLYLLALARMYASARIPEERTAPAEWVWRGLLAFAGVAAILASQSRGPAIAAAAGTAYLAASGGLSWPSVRATGLVVVAGGAVTGLAVATGLADPFLRRVEVMDAVVGYGRLELWELALEEFTANPILGGSLEFGLGVPDNQYPHNLVLEAFMATGVAGGSALVAALGICVVRSRRIGAREPRLAWVGALFIQYLVAAMFSGALYSLQYTWVLLAAAIAAEGMVGNAGDPRPAPLSRRAAPTPSGRRGGISRPTTDT